jgi:hypothetical protein
VDIGAAGATALEHALCLSVINAPVNPGSAGISVMRF